MENVPDPLPPELEAARMKAPVPGRVLMLNTEEGLREFDKTFTRTDVELLRRANAYCGKNELSTEGPFLLELADRIKAHITRILDKPQ